MRDLFGEETPEPTFEEQYRAYILSPAWRKRVAAALARASYKCERCERSRFSRKLEVHHKTYERFRAEIPDDLEVVCGECHKAADLERAERTADRRAQRQEAALWEARLDGWATKVYGEYWYERFDQDLVQERFEYWLANRDE